MALPMKQRSSTNVGHSEPHERWNIAAHLNSDATAAICQIKHLDTTDLWIQDKIRSKKMKLSKVLGTENKADVLTKYVDRATMTAALKKMNLHHRLGRPACAPVAMGA